MAAAGFVPVAFGILAVLVFAGCVAEEEPPAKAGPTAGAVGSTPGGASFADPAPGSSKAAKVDAERAVFPPVWTVGMGWTYEVSGKRVREPYTVTLGVVAVDSGHYVTGADNPLEFEEGLLGSGGIFRDGIQKETLAWKQADVWQDFIGFGRAPGETWAANLFYATFRLTKIHVGDVTGPDGPGLGIRVEGEDGPEKIVVEYHDAARFLSLLEWRNGTGEMLLSYRLTGFEAAGTSGLIRWQVTDSAQIMAQSISLAVGATRWESDGSGDHVFVVGKSLAHMRPAVGKLLDPDHNERFTHTSTENEMTQDSATTGDMAGEWHLIGVSAGAQVIVTVYQINVVEYG